MGNVCPLNGDNHRYFVHTTKVEFESVGKMQLDSKNENVMAIQDYINNNDLYLRVEYAYMGCNCGSAIKSKVKEFNYGESA